MLLLACSSKLQLQINYVVTYQINLSKNFKKTSQYSIHSLVLNKRKILLDSLSRFSLFISWLPIKSKDNLFYACRYLPNNNHATLNP